MKFKGKVKVITKGEANEKGTLFVKATLDCGIYFEVSFPEEELKLYERLWKAERGTEITVEIK